VGVLLGREQVEPEVKPWPRNASSPSFSAGSCGRSRSLWGGP